MLKAYRLGLYLEKSTPAILFDPNQLASQLMARLDGNHPVIAGLISCDTRPTKLPWLRPLSPNLISAGSAMMRMVRSPPNEQWLNMSLATFGNLMAGGGSKGILNVWSLITGSSVFKVDLVQKKIIHSRVAGGIFCVAISSSFVFAALYDSTIAVFNLVTKEYMQRIETEAIPNALDCYGNRLICVTNDGVIRCFSGIDFSLLEELHHPGYTKNAPSFSQICISECLLAAGALSKHSRWDIYVWDFSVSKHRRIPLAHEKWINGLEFSRNKKFLVSASSDCKIKV